MKCVTVMRQLNYKSFFSATMAVLTLKQKIRSKFFQFSVLMLNAQMNREVSDILSFLDTFCYTSLIVSSGSVILLKS
jgi:hypothetical protein